MPRQHGASPPTAPKEIDMHIARIAALVLAGFALSSPARVAADIDRSAVEFTPPLAFSP